MDVGDWLRSLGLTQYEALFRENDIDTEVLAELTESDLTGLGVSLGHRKRLLKAIANLGSTETQMSIFRIAGDATCLLNSAGSPL